MADNAGEAGSAGGSHPKPPARPGTPPAPPPRPPLSDRSPAPISPPTPPPAVIIAARSLWVTSFVLGFLAIGVAFLAGTSQVDELQQVIGQLMPGESEGTRERVADVAYWASVAGIAVVIIAEALLLRLLMNRRRGIRWVLLLFLFAHAGVAVIADAFLAVGDVAVYLRVLLAAQLLLAGIAALCALLPGSGRWLGRNH